MPNRALTVAVPPALFDHFRQRADQTQRTIEDEVVLALAATLPDQTDLPRDLASTLASLEALEDDTLWRLARSRVADRDAERLEELGDRRQRAGLTDGELREADELIERHDRVVVVRAEAAALLKQRGHDISKLIGRV